MNEIVYFDLDGVLANWVEQYKNKSNIPLDKLEKMSQEERHKIKEKLFNYDFFFTMKPITKGVNLYKNLVRTGATIAVLSATGDINKEEVARAKRDWVKKYIGNIDVILVDDGEHKWSKRKQGYDKHILIDDREKVLNAWKKHGGVPIKFVQ